VLPVSSLHIGELTGGSALAVQVLELHELLAHPHLRELGRADAVAPTHS
jgi:hypothetical protein